LGFDPRAVFPVCLGETGLTGLGNRSDRFWSQWPFKKIFGRHVVLCLRSSLVQVSSRLEFVCLDFDLVVLWGFLGETGVTGLQNRSDRFYLGSKCTSCFPLRVLSVDWFGFCS
jgi:hypothetical protein